MALGSDGSRYKDLGKSGHGARVGYCPACHMLYSAESVWGICGPMLIPERVANVQEKQQHFKETEHFEYNAASCQQLLKPAVPLFCSLTHSLWSTYRQMETSNPESPAHNLGRLQALLSQSSACLGTSVG